MISLTKHRRYFLRHPSYEVKRFFMFYVTLLETSDSAAAAGEYTEELER